jgi:hypothetical protein
MPRQARREPAGGGGGQPGRTPDVVHEIGRRCSAGQPVDEIAEAIGTTPKSLRATCSKLRISLRTKRSPRGGARFDAFKPGKVAPLKVTLAPDERARLEIEAGTRGVRVEELAHDILALVARDALVSAVLDP